MSTRARRRVQGGCGADAAALGGWKRSKGESVAEGKDVLSANAASAASQAERGGVSTAAADPASAQAKPPLVPLLSKSIPPLAPSVHLPRPRVTALLRRGMSQKLTFISAAEGFGKTTALLDWHESAAAEGATVVWFTVDRLDVDEARFGSTCAVRLRAPSPTAANASRLWRTTDRLRRRGPFPTSSPK